MYVSGCVNMGQFVCVAVSLFLCTCVCFVSCVQDCSTSTSTEQVCRCQAARQISLPKAGPLLSPQLEEIVDK